MNCLTQFLFRERPDYLAVFENVNRVFQTVVIFTTRSPTAHQTPFQEGYDISIQREFVALTSAASQAAGLLETLWVLQW